MTQLQAVSNISYKQASGIYNGFTKEKNAGVPDELLSKYQGKSSDKCEKFLNASAANTRAYLGCKNISSVQNYNQMIKMQKMSIN